MADLNDLLAKLGVQPSAESARSVSGEHTGRQSASSQRQASASFPQPLFSPTFPGLPPTHTENGSTTTFNVTPGQAAPSDRTTNLLNLLKFNPHATDAVPKIPWTPSGSRVVSADFMPAPKASSSRAQTPSGSFLGAAPQAASSPIADGRASTDILLKLLNRTPSSTFNVVPLESSNAALEARANSVLNTMQSAVRQGMHTPPTPNFTAKAAPLPSQPSQPLGKSSVFTYVNPFDQLAASSPRNRTPKPDAAASGESAAASGLSEREDVQTGGPFASTLPSTKLSMPTPLPDGRTQIDALIGIGSQNRNGTGETVTEALNDIAAQADKAVRDALAEVDGAGPSSSMAIKKKHTSAVVVSKLAGPDLSTEAAADSWESADAEDTAEASDDIPLVPVYNLPMKPFHDITIKPTAPAAPVREEIIVKIASFKKDFDQADRALVGATINHITYAMSKGGGLRIIKQDDGNNVSVFKGVDNVMFNIAISASSPTFRANNTETILATGLNGSVYWTAVPIDQGDGFSSESLTQTSFIMPPLPSTDESNTSQAQLKTRAKKSSRHPEYFGLGRGKSIHVVWPEVITSAKYVDSTSRVVDSEKYLSERCLKITTGKAGKDFVFSEDDSVIASLDKAGKIKLWDIRSLVDVSNGNADGRRTAIEVKTPLMTLHTTSLPSPSGSEKSWPTSLAFLDKDRVTSKSIAMRYMLVGMKQNHSIQLWDIGVRKSVQELNFPHEKETDPVCSIAYHSKSAIIAVGHPTRNSVYLVHLSAPKYNLPTMSQADYIHRLSQGDVKLTQPESTAIMTGIREISLSSIGLLRSLDMIYPAQAASAKVDSDDRTIIEIYVMHARGVGCLNLKRQELGWDKDGRVIDARDAVKEGNVVLKEMESSNAAANEVDGESIDTKSASDITVTPAQNGPSSATRDALPEKVVQASILAKSDATKAKLVQSSETEKQATAQTQPPQKTAVQVSQVAEPTLKIVSTSTPAPVVSSNTISTSSNPVKADSGKKTVNVTLTSSVARAPVGTIGVTPEHKAQTEKVSTVSSNATPKSEAPHEKSASEAVESTESRAISQLGPSPQSVKEIADPKDILPLLQTTLARHFDTLYRRVDEERRVQEAAGAAKQDAVLRLVSSSLTDNVEKSLTRIITSNIEKLVIPTVTNVTSATIDRKLSELLGPRLDAAISTELKLALPIAAGQALQMPEVLGSISSLVSQKVANHVESHVMAVLADTITPAFKALSISTAQKVTGEVEQRVGAQLQSLELQRRSDRDDIERLTALTGDLLDTVRGMADTQLTLREEIMKLQQHLAQERENHARGNRLSSVPSETVPLRDEEYMIIAEAMGSGREEEGLLLVRSKVL